MNAMKTSEFSIIVQSFGNASKTKWNAKSKSSTINILETAWKTLLKILIR